MRAHVNALFTSDLRGRLVRHNEPGGAQAPRFWVGRTPEGAEWRVRHDTSEEVARSLQAALLSEPSGEELLDPPYGAEPYEAILASVHAIERKWAGPTYHFPAHLPSRGGTTLITAENRELLLPYLESWIADVGVNDPVIATVVDDKAVSVCCSVRKGDVADEVGVETAVPFRRQGHGALAVATWAETVRAAGQIPLYSTSWTNVASMALAQSLGLVRYGATLHFT